MEDSCDFEVATVTLASGSAWRIWRYTRWTMDSYSPSAFLNILMNCLERISLERGQRRFPEPPESKIIFIGDSPSSSLGPDRIVQIVLIAYTQALFQLSFISPTQRCGFGHIQQLSGRTIRL